MRASSQQVLIDNVTFTSQADINALQHTQQEFTRVRTEMLQNSRRANETADRAAVAANRAVKRMASTGTRFSRRHLREAKEGLPRLPKN